jgi:predicted ribonuclease YlaK
MAAGPDFHDEEGSGRRRSRKHMRREARRATRSSASTRKPDAMQLGHIEPMTENQRIAFDAWDDGKHLLLHGCAGTGKTLIAMYLGLREVLEEEMHTKVVLVRSAVPTRDQGFMPGNLKEKSQYYELPFMSACTDIYERGDAYGMLKGSGKIEFITTSYIRGVTLHDSIIIVDEIQNLTMHEISSVITRVGQNSRLILMGDFKQSDFVRADDRKGVRQLIEVVKKMGSFSLIEFGHHDILRSDVVKEWIVAKDELGIID